MPRRYEGGRWTWSFRRYWDALADGDVDPDELARLERSAVRAGQRARREGRRRMAGCPVCGRSVRPGL